MPPAALTSAACLRARPRPYLQSSCRNGVANARSAPMSGQVPTTTATPAIRRPRTAEPSCSAARVRRVRRVTSLGPTRITATSGRCPTSARATWVASSADRARATATLHRSTRRPAEPSASSAAS